MDRSTPSCLGLDSLATELENKLGAIRTLQEIFVRHPDLAVETARCVAPLSHEYNPESHFEKVANFLRSAGNRPQTMKALVAATGLSRSAVAYIIYTAKPHAFEKIDSAESRIKKWAINVFVVF
jgi:hypothetical protein